MVLTSAVFLGSFSVDTMVPTVVANVTECFKNHAFDLTAIMGLYSLAFSLTLPFFIPV